MTQQGAVIMNIDLTVNIGTFEGYHLCIRCIETAIIILTYLLLLRDDLTTNMHRNNEMYIGAIGIISEVVFMENILASR